MPRSGYLAVLTFAIIVSGQAPVHAFPAVSASVAIYVGYADTEVRAADSGICANCFPSPWCGSPGVQFIGSSTNYNGNSSDTGNCKGGGWDTAAILVTNTGITTLTLTNLTIVLPLPASGNRGTPSCDAPQRPITFDLWFGQKYYFDNASRPAYLGGPITLAPGGQAIFAGTSSDGSYTCPTGNYPSAPAKATYDFDTSDANFLSGCTPTTDSISDPQIYLSVTGSAPLTPIDKGRVLDTGGIDTGNCGHTAVDPQWGHENLGWRLVDSTCGEGCPMNQLSLGSAQSLNETTTTASFQNVTQGLTAGGAPAVSLLRAVYVASAIVVILGVAYVLVRRRRPR